MLHRRKPPTATPKRGRSQGQEERPGAVRAADRAADGDPRHHRGEHRAAEPLGRPESDRVQHQLDNHELLAHLRQPAALRRPRRRSARTTPDVPDRPRHLHRLLVCLSDGRHRRCPLRSPRGPGSRRSAALPGSARDHHGRLPGQAAGQGARRLGSRRRRRCRDRRARRRRSDRVRRLADDLLRQPADRSRTRHRRTQDHPRRHPQAALDRSRPPRRPARDHEPRRNRLRDHPGRGRRLDIRSDSPLRPRRSRRPRLPSPPSSAAPTHRCCGSSAWPTAQSAAASS